MPQNYNTCQEKAVEQTFVVDSSRLLSFAVGYIVGFQKYNRKPFFPLLQYLRYRFFDLSASQTLSDDAAVRSKENDVWYADNVKSLR